MYRHFLKFTKEVSCPFERKYFDQFLFFLVLVFSFFTNK